jgi:hypothetical protein
MFRAAKSCPSSLFFCFSTYCFVLLAVQDALKRQVSKSACNIVLPLLNYGEVGLNGCCSRKHVGKAAMAHFPRGIYCCGGRLLYCSEASSSRHCAANILKTAHSRGKIRSTFAETLGNSAFEGKDENTRISSSRATLKGIIGKSRELARSRRIEWHAHQGSTGKS